MSSDQVRFHYVQKAYLKNFSRADRKGEVYELNKETLTSEQRGINTIANEEYFYHNSMENLFNKEFESKTPKVFRKIIDKRIEDLNITDFEVLAKSVNYHILRTKNVRLQIKAELELSGKQYSEEDTNKWIKIWEENDKKKQEFINEFKKKKGSGMLNLHLYVRH